MSVTERLLRLYLIDKQLRGLKSRLGGAEKDLNEQSRLLTEQDARLATLHSQLKQAEASARNEEVEADAIEQRIEALRQRMNSARTSKEHSACLTEIGTLKADKKLVEDRALESLTKAEAIREQSREVEAEREERLRRRERAQKERDDRAHEIKDRLAELEQQRVTAIEDVPAATLLVYEERLTSGVEEVMAAIEEQDRRNMEYTCAACYTHLPIEQVSILLRRGDLTKCPSCHAILYMEAALRDDITTSQQKKKKSVAVDE